MRFFCFLFPSVVLLSAGFGSFGAPMSPLEDVFRDPPSAARPQTWYHLMNGNVTKEGITCDFEALATLGVGGVQMFDAGCAIPAGALSFNSPEWFDLIEHAAKEARRLGLEICLPNSSGWSSSGGPWVQPSNAMKVVTFRERRLKGPLRFAERLERETGDNGFYRDIAVVAFPTPAAEAVTYPDVRTTVNAHGFSFVSEKPFTVRGMTFTLSYSLIFYGDLPVTVEVSSDGTRFETLETYSEFLAQHGVCDWGLRGHAFPKEVTARAIRVTFGKSKVACRPVDPRLTAALPLSNLKAKAFFLRDELPVARDTAVSRADQAVARESVLDLTDRMSADGILTWDVPPGDWTVLRVGCKCNGVKNRPASAFGEGLEVDKLSAAAVDFHFEQYVAKLCDRLGKLAGAVESGFNNVLVDSYEVGSQNWTVGFERTFADRRGYSLIPYLPVLAGHLVGSLDESERFLEDFRRVLADEFAANYAGTLAEKCRQRGLTLSLEPYGNGPFDNLQYGEFAGIPMGEYWSHALDGNFSTDDGNARIPAQVAHVWGRKIAATESFTAAALDGLPWNSGKWLTTPFSIKAQGDRIYARGVNRIIYHRFVHQPWPGDRYLPGMTMGLYGMHFDRTQTWWDFADGWIRYQTRCQALLQRGENVADVLFYCGSEAPNQGGNPGGHRQFGENPDLMLPPGFSWDVCAINAFKLLTVKGGQVVAPSGARYPLLALPPLETMGLDELVQLEKLIDAGAKVCSRTRPTRAPGLVGYPSADREVRDRAARIWTKGVFVVSPVEALAQLGIGPDFAASGMPMDGDKGLAFTHRREGDADWYFVAMPNREPVSFEASFRTQGRTPEIWDAERGTMVRAREWRVENGRTVVRLNFPVSGSAFVVFRTKDAADVPFEPAFDMVRTASVDGGWTVRFPHGFAPNAVAEGADEIVEFPRLSDWKDHPADGVRYFSGTATYVKTIDGLSVGANERVILDLGNVREVARVTVNGKRLPALWKPPFEVDITEAAKTGSAKLEVEIANLWANRLIGDDRLCADDCAWGKDGDIKRIPDWVREGRKSPTGRMTFTTWKHWKKTDDLLSSGLLGPVTIRTERRCADCVADVLRPLPAGAVRLRGRLDEAIRKTINGWTLGNVPYRDFAKFFVSGKPKYATGEMWGKFVRAAAMQYRYSGDERTKGVLETAISDILATQRENGSVSCDRIEDQPGGMSGDLWERKYVMLAMERCYDIVKRDERVLDALVRQADCIISQIGDSPKVDIRSLGWSANHIESSTLLEPFVRLYRLTGERRFLEFAAYVVRCGGAHGYDLVAEAFAGKPPHRMGGPYPKAYEMLSFFEGLLDYHRVTGDAYVRTAALNLFENVLANELTIVGNGGGDQPYHPRVRGEAWDNTALEQTNPKMERMMETCTGVTWLKFCGHVLSLTEDTRAADAIEKYVYNGLLGAMKLDGTGFSYVNLLNGHKVTNVGWGWKFPSGPVTCCNLNGPTGLAFVPYYAVMQGVRGPVVNLYEAFEATAYGGGTTVGLEAKKGLFEDGIWRLEVSSEEPCRFPLRLRIPAWSGKTDVRVNGAEVETVRAGGWLELDRTWSRGDAVEIAFDFTARLVPAPHGSDRAGDGFAAVTWGPLALCRDENTDPEFDKPVRIVAADDGTVAVRRVAPTHPTHRLEFEVPTADGPIRMTDYASQDGWNGKRIMTWLPTKE